MAYFAEYTLSVRNIKDKAQYEALVDVLKEYDLIGYAFIDGTYYEGDYEAIFCSYDEVKWSKHSQNMVRIAEKFPNMYFELTGKGEHSTAFWKEYYHDMDIETCRGEVIYEEPKKIQWKNLIPPF